MYFCPFFVHSPSRVATAGTRGVSRMPWVFVDHVLPSTQPARVWAQPRTVFAGVETETLLLWKETHRNHIMATSRELIWNKIVRIFRKKNRHHTIHKTITGNEPLILSNTRDKCCRHEIQSSIRNPDKLCLDLRAGGWSHTLNLPKCSTIHIYLLHRSHSHSKPHHPSPPPPHHQVAITAPSTKSRGDREIIHIRYMFLEIHSIKKALYLFLPRSTLVALDCAAQAKRLGKCDRSVVPWFGFLLEMVGLIQLMEDIWLTSWYGKYIM